MTTIEPSVSAERELDSALESMLQQIASRDPALAQAVLVCAVPRWFDQELLAALLPQDPTAAADSAATLQALCNLPLCRLHPSRAATWVLRAGLRAQLLEHPTVQAEAEALHRRAAGSFEQRMGARSLAIAAGAQPETARFGDEEWQMLATEWAYHLLHADLARGLAAVHRICAQAFVAASQGDQWDVTFCSRFLEQLEWPAGRPEADEAMGQLKDGFGYLEAYIGPKAAPMLAGLAAEPALTPAERSTICYWLGMIHLRDEGREGPAREQLERAHAADPASGRVHAALAWVFRTPGVWYGRLDLARCHARRAVRLSPGLDAGYLERGYIAQLTEEWDRAAAWFQKALAAEPESHEGFLALSEACAARGMVDEALRLVDEAERRVPGSTVYALVRKGRVLSGARRYAEAERAYSQARDEAPELTEADIALGDLLLLRGYSARAEALYREAIRKEPGSVEGYLALAELYGGQDRAGRALAVCEEAQRAGAAGERLLIALSSLYRQLDRLDEVQDVQRRIVELDADQRYARHCVVGSVLLERAWRRRDGADREQQLAGVRAEFEAARQLDARRAWAAIELAEEAVLRDDAAAAQGQLRHVARFAPWARYDALVSVGRAYLHSFQPATAAEMLEQAARMAPWRQAAWRALAELYAWQGDPGGVERAWAELERISPALGYERLIAVGDAYQRVADLGRARAAYAGARDADPESGLAYLRLASLDETRGKLDEAVADYQQAAEKAPDFAALAGARTTAILSQQGQHNMACKAARDAIKADPQRVEGYSALADLGIKTGDEQLIQEARDRLAGIKEPRLRYDFENALGNSYRLERPEYDAQARRAYRACLRLDPDRAEAYIGLGLLHVDRRAYGAARRRLEQARRLDSANPDVAVALSRLYQARGDLPKVQAALEQLTRIEPTARYDACLSLGDSYAQQGQPGPAEEQYRRAIALAPWRAEAYISAGALLDELPGRSADAEVLYHQTIEAAGVNYVALGRHYEQHGMPESALRVYRYAVARDAELQEAYPAMVVLLDKLDRHDEALAACDQMAERADLTYEAQLLRGDLFSAQGRYDDASQAIARALALDPAASQAYLALAELEQRREQPDRAAQILRQGLEAVPADPELPYQCALLYEEQQRPDEAIPLYLAAAARHQDDETASTLYTRAGDLLIEQERYPEAVTVLEQARVRNPANAGACLSLGYAYERQSRLDEAVALFTRATEIAPSYGAAYLACARVYGRQVNLEGLDRMLRQMIERNPGEQYEAYLTGAEAYRLAGDGRQQEQLYRKAVEADPVRLEARLSLALLLEAQGRLDESIAAFREAAARQPDQEASQVYSHIGELLLQPGRASRAARALEKALRLDSSNALAHLALGRLYEQQGTPERAAAQYEQVCALEPAHGDAAVALGRLYGRQGRTEDLAELARRIRAPDDGPLARCYSEQLLAEVYRAAGDARQERLAIARATRAWRAAARQPELVTEAYACAIALGDRLLERNRPAAARGIYTRALALDPARPEAYLAVALLEQQRGKPEQAALTLRQGLEAAPDSPDLTYRLALLHEEQQRLEEAIPLYREAAAHHQDDATASDIYARAGDLLIGRERYADAVRELEQARARNPANPNAYMSLGWALEQLSRLDEAAAMYDRAVGLRPTSDAYLGLVRVSGGRKDIPALAAAARQALRLIADPADMYEAMLAIADAYRAAEAHEQAIAQLRAAADLGPERPDAYIRLGYMYEVLQQRARARGAYVRVAELAPDLRADVSMRLGYLFELDRRREEAERSYRQAIALAPERPEPYLGLGELLVDGGRDEEALELFTTAAAKGGSTAANAQLSVAAVSRSLGRDEQMREACARVIALVDQTASPDFNALRQKGLAQHMCGAYQDASKTLHRALEANPQDFQAHLYLALTLIGLGRQGEARRELERGVALARHRGDYRYTLEEAEALAARTPAIPGAAELLARLASARDSCST